MIPDSVLRHLRDRETPASLYLAIKLYYKTDNASLVEIMHNRGMCVSHRYLKILGTDLANSVIN